jgi:hypothetical protein
VTDPTQANTKASRCVWWPGLLIWLAAAIAASLLGWSTKTRALVTLGALVLAVLVVAARQQVRDESGGSRPQVPPGRPGPLSMGAGVGPSSRPEPEPTRPEPEPPPQPTKPPEPEPPKPEAISEETLGKAEWYG